MTLQGITLRDYAGLAMAALDRTGLHGFVAPFTLLVHYLRKHDVSDWLDSQVYFQPYPKALGSR